MCENNGELSDDYVMGLVEGEGCFSVSIQRYIDRHPRRGQQRRRKGNAFTFRTSPSFRMTLAKKDKSVLEALQRKFGFGGIYTVNRSKTDPQRQDVCQYYVQNFADLFKLKDFFKKQQFYTTKKASFELWCQVLDIIKENKHMAKEGFLKICELRDKMNPMKGKTHKRSTEKIKAILENPPEYVEAYIHNTEF